MKIMVHLFDAVEHDKDYDCTAVRPVDRILSNDPRRRSSANVNPNESQPGVYEDSSNS